MGNMGVDDIGCDQIAKCGWCHNDNHAEVCWKMAAKCGKCGGPAHPGVSSDHGGEGCTADHRTRQYALIAR